MPELTMDPGFAGVWRHWASPRGGHVAVITWGRQQQTAHRESCPSAPDLSSDQLHAIATVLEYLITSFKATSESAGSLYHMGTSDMLGM